MEEWESLKEPVCTPSPGSRAPPLLQTTTLSCMSVEAGVGVQSVGLSATLSGSLHAPPASVLIP